MAPQQTTAVSSNSASVLGGDLRLPYRKAFELLATLLAALRVSGADPEEHACKAAFQKARQLADTELRTLCDDVLFEDFLAQALEKVIREADEAAARIPLSEGGIRAFESLRHVRDAPPNLVAAEASCLIKTTYVGCVEAARNFYSRHVAAPFDFPNISLGISVGNDVNEAFPGRVIAFNASLRFEDGDPPDHKRSLVKVKVAPGLLDRGCLPALPYVLMHEILCHWPQMARFAGRRPDPEFEVDLARALLAMGSESAWLRALKVPGRFWTAQEEEVLASQFSDVVPAPFAVTIDCWTEAEHGNPLMRATGAFLRITFRDKVATRHAALLSKSIEDGVSLSAYPLALWLARGWWRLRWEPAFLGPPPSAWRNAHDLPAVESGVEWPRLTLWFNGERMFAACRPSDPSASASTQYIANFDERISAEEFEGGVDSFLNEVLTRLDLSAVNHVGETELGAIWRDVCLERADPILREHRRLEAMLGLNRKEAPEGLIENLKGLSTRTSASAIYELAPACSGQGAAGTLATVREIVDSSEGMHGRIAHLPAILSAVQIAEDELPWQRGLRLARVCRKSLGLGTDNISNAKLAETLGLTEHELCQSAVSAKSLPFVLALRCCGTDKVNFLFQKRGLPSRRFEAARFLVDAFLTPLDDPCLLQTQTRRVRQQTQRAFAVELLAPIAALCDVLEGDFSAEAIDEAADHFGISPVAAQFHLQNNAAAEFATAA